MSFSSEAHRKKCQELVKEGKMLQSTYDKHEKETGNRKLPDHIEQPTKPFKMGKVKIIK
jgi:hypothetical protein